MPTVCQYLLLSLLAMSLWACGGGGGGGTAAPVASLSISDVSPRSAPPGATLMVSGSGLNGVTLAQIGAVDAAFSRISDTSLSVVVPNSASTGSLRLSGAGSSVASSFLITVEAPTVSSLSPSAVVPGGQLTLNGSFLDQVSSVSLGTVNLPIVSQSASQLVLTVPVEALSGALLLRTAGGLSRSSAFSVTVLTPLTVSAFSVNEGLVGSSLLLSGTGLDRISTVRFGATVATIVSQRSDQLALTVPNLAPGSYALTLIAADGQLQPTTTFRVAPAITVTSMSPGYGLAGTTVTLLGSGLDEVDGITVGGSAQTILAGRSDSQLQFNLAAGSSSGDTQLQASSQSAVSAGCFGVGAAPQGCVSRIDFVQTYSQSAGAQYQRLVAGKPAVVRAYVLGARGGSPSPGVTLVVRNGNTVLASLPMNGPSVLPDREMPYSLAQTFSATLIASQVINGLNVSVEQSGGGVGLSATPQLAGASNMKLTLVPIRTGSQQGSAPATSDVRSALRRTLPLADTAIELSTRGVFSTNVVSSAPVSSEDWSAVLGALDDLREVEAPNRHYFGFVANASNTETAGLAYVNGPGFTRSDTGIGLDTSYFDWENTFIHEMGHNLSREHAPCGSVGADFDTNYPYANGALGSVPLYNIESVYLAGYPNSVSGAPGSLIDPAGKNDIMSYCSNADWFSDYNYHGVQSHLLTNTYPKLINQAADTELLVLRGELDGDNVRFHTPSAAFGRPRYDAGGAYTLRLTLADGSVLLQPVRSQRVADGRPGLQHFSLRLPHPGPLRKLEMLRGEQLLSQPASTAAKRSGAATATARVDWQESQGVLSLRWDAQAFPRLNVLHLGSERRVLALGLSGGQASLALDELPVGGRFEFVLAHALDAQRLQAPR